MKTFAELPKNLKDSTVALLKHDQHLAARQSAHAERAFIRNENSTVVTKKSGQKSEPYSEKKHNLKRVEKKYEIISDTVCIVFIIGIAALLISSKFFDADSKKPAIKSQTESTR